MDPDKLARTFFFQDQDVGYFEGTELPASPGQYRYVPYRSVGHYKLIGALQNAGPQRCHYVASGEKRPFTVVRWVKYGVLEIADFDAPEGHRS